MFTQKKADDNLVESGLCDENCLPEIVPVDIGAKILQRLILSSWEDSGDGISRAPIELHKTVVSLAKELKDAMIESVSMNEVGVSSTTVSKRKPIELSNVDRSILSMKEPAEKKPKTMKEARSEVVNTVSSTTMGKESSVTDDITPSSSEEDQSKPVCDVDKPLSVAAASAKEDTKPLYPPIRPLSTINTKSYLQVVVAWNETVSFQKVDKEKQSQELGGVVIYRELVFRGNATAFDLVKAIQCAFGIEVNTDTVLPTMY
jgi:hypothetical protein